MSSDLTPISASLERRSSDTAVIDATRVQPVHDVQAYLEKRTPQPSYVGEEDLLSTLPNSKEKPVQSETMALVRACQYVASLVKEKWAVQPACVAALKIHSKWNWKLNTFRPKYDEWAAKQDWIVLVNRAKAPASWRESNCGLPAAFLALCETRFSEFANRGGNRQALLSLKRQWKTGRNEQGQEEAIPGYEVLADGQPWNKRNPERIPDGWTEGNIARHLNQTFKLRELPADFISFWKFLVECHQRVTSNARRQLIQIWQARQSFEIRGEVYDMIPGYGGPSGTEWPVADPRTDVPAGWTVSNLDRHVPDDYELAAARIGIKKAGALGFKIRTSRLGLKLGEFMEFDDHEFNVKVNFPGQLRALRPRCFGAVDALTDCMFSMVIKPTFWDMEAEMKRTLTEKDFMWFIVAVLTHRGYRADIGTMLLCEWGTSAIRGNLKLKLNDPLRDDFEKRIFDCTGGKVRVDRGGRFNKPANPGQFAAPAGGNFRFKPHIEQFWRMLDDWLDALKGQTGKGRDFAPEEMERADAYNNKLLKAARAMGTEQAARLILPRMTFAEFTQTANVMMNLVNDDPDHACNSWEDCNFITKEYRREISAPWKSLPLLAGEPAEVQQAVNENDLLFRARRMTRAEADRKHQGELTPLPMMMIPSLVGEQFARDPVEVRGGKFEFQDKNEFCSPDSLVFLAVDANGHPLREGERYLPYCNPLSPDALVICDAHGAVVSVCPPDLQPARNDEAGVKRAMGVKNHWQATKLAPQRARHAAAGIGVDFMRQHNAQTVATAPPVEKITMDPVPVEDCTEDILARAQQVPASESQHWD